MERVASTESDVEKHFTEIETLQVNVNVKDSICIEVKRIAEILEKDFSFMKFNDSVKRRIVECIRVMGDKFIVVIFKGDLKF